MKRITWFSIAGFAWPLIGLMITVNSFDMTMWQQVGVLMVGGYLAGSIHFISEMVIKSSANNYASKWLLDSITKVAKEQAENTAKAEEMVH